MARGTVHARTGLALVDVVLTVVASGTARAHARVQRRVNFLVTPCRHHGVRIRAVDASRAVQAGVRRALVQVVLTVQPGPAGQARALVLHHTRRIRARSVRAR